jgi:CheY-like chemotaxis protein
MTILCIDNDPDDLEIFREAVRSINPQIACLLARDADGALKFLTDAVVLPEYIFIDINMPGMNGIQLLRQLRTFKEYTDIPVIMYSTSVNHTDYNESIRQGAIGFIQKANTLKDMYFALQKFIN